MGLFKHNKAKSSPRQRGDTFVREMLRRDLQMVLRIDLQLFSQPFSGTQLALWLSRPHCRAIVCQHGEQVVGYATYELSRRYLHLDRIGVAPAYQARGVGTMMMDHIKDRIHHRGAITALAAMDDYQACEWFSARGFHVAKVWLSDDIEFHWPRDEGARILERVAVGNVRVS